MKESVGTFFVGIIILAVLFVMVRPGSQGPGLVSSVSDGLTNILKASTGGGTW